jgi:hypothetical protein
MAKKTNMLPSKPSALIRVALEDLAQVEKMKKVYRVNMMTFHELDWFDNRCHVCFAGAVMAQTLGSDPNKRTFPEDFDDGIRGKLRALDHFRLGCISKGLAVMGMQRPMFLSDDVDMIPYRTDKKRFKKDMNTLADVLEVNGL